MSTKQNVTINVRANGVQQTTRQMNGLSASMRKAGLSAAQLAASAAIIGGAVVGIGRKAVEAADAYTNLSNQTKVFASNQDSAAFKMQDTINIARKMNSSLNEVGQVYQRISMVQEGVGFSDETASKIVENLTKAVKLSGATAQEAEGALRQFAQGMAANRLSGQELNSVLEQTPMIAKILADSIGAPVGALRKLGEQGLLTTEVLVDTFGGSIEELEEKFEKFTFTLESQWISVKREMSLVTGQLMEMSGTSEALGKVVKEQLTDRLIKLSDVLKKGGDDAKMIKAIFQGLATTGVALAAAALGALVVGMVALVNTIPLVIAGFISLASFVYGYEQANKTAVSESDRLSAAIQKQKDEIREWKEGGYGTSGSHYDEMHQNLDNLIRKRGAHIETLKEEAEAAKELAKANQALNMSTLAAFVNGDLTMDQAVGAIGYDLDSSSVAKTSQDQRHVALAESSGYSLLGGFGDDPEFLYQMQTEAANDAADAAERLRQETEKLAETEAKRLEQQERQIEISQDLAARTIGGSAALKADYSSDIDTLNGGKAGATPEQLQLLEEAIRLRTESYDLDILEEEHKTKMFDLNEGLMDQTLTMGELTAGVTASMAEGFRQVAEDTFNVSGAIANITSQAVGGLSQEIANLATTGDGSFKQLGRSFVTMITQMIVKLVVMMGIIAAISAIPGGSAVLQMMGIGGGAGAPAGGGGGGFKLAGTPTGGGFNGGGFNPSGGSLLTPPGRAAGGPVGGGMPILVGERGPELFVPPQSGSIKNNTTTQGMMGQQAPQVTVVNVDSTEDTLNAIGSEEGEAVIMNVIQRNPEILRSLG